MRSRGNFHNVEDSTQRTWVTVEIFESSSMVQGTEGGAKYNCNYCQKDITGKIRIKCAVCLNFDLCVECMSVGAEINTHKCDHAYRVIVSLRFVSSFLCI
ncbi:PREDICTED: transcriptional adapter ADA2b-like [Brassica oleracea var. oleracea]|uniref:transcriptional adapter ADA2b-like n=1 Tax=Brassica oleracea var. oleracea TaxID=109376 RepID=UPI0006A72D5E|nr:PREDICTED: transcriptional adapter ADA2b-like [Brassica oleracea var. oleracea]